MLFKPFKAANCQHFLMDFAVGQKFNGLENSFGFFFFYRNVLQNLFTVYQLMSLLHEIQLRGHSSSTSFSTTNPNLFSHFRTLNSTNFEIWHPLLVQPTLKMIRKISSDVWQIQLDLIWSVKIRWIVAYPIHFTSICQQELSVTSLKYSDYTLSFRYQWNETKKEITRWNEDLTKVLQSDFHFEFCKPFPSFQLAEATQKHQDEFWRKALFVPFFRQRIWSQMRFLMS